ncbi:MAG TPA: phosphoglucosamine mutase [Alphaproteobacteria bacterium]
MRKLFGTDGIRGLANAEPMTAETMLKVALAAGRFFTRGDHRHRVVIGKDTRLSGYLIEPALTAGFISVGMDVVLTGPMPTPAVAMLTRSLRADLGVVISASHNPYADNGVKFFGPDGYKLSDEIEAEVERTVDSGEPLASPERLGRARRLDDAEGRYIEFVKATFPRGLRLDGLKIVVDCANGAAYRIAPAVLWELGADVVTIGVDPDGFNINQGCGAMVPDALQSQVVAHGADLGIALDGDADRLQMVDQTGHLIDGDQVMGLIARSWQEAGRLNGGCIAATVMSNLGLERYLASRGVGLVRAPVGDRYVLEAMRERGCNLGGEQSGHIIMSDYATTGDGLIAALQVLGVLVAAGRPASEVLRVFAPLPQIMKNVRVNGGTPLDAHAVKAAIAAAELRLGTAGRLLVRRSGTEQLIRVMAEGEDKGLVDRIVDDVAAAIAQAAGA